MTEAEETSISLESIPFDALQNLYEPTTRTKFLWLDFIFH